MPIDLRKYDQKPNDWTWAEREEKRLETEGGLNLAGMQNAIYNTLMKVPEGGHFDIAKSVKPQNHEVFIKTCCEFLEYYPDYRFNRLMNKFYHEPPTPKGEVKKEPNEK